MHIGVEPQIEECLPPDAPIRKPWQALWARFRAITPSQVAHFVLVSSALGLISWLL